MSDLLGMSDEDFLQLNAPGPAPASDGDVPVVEAGNETQDELTNETDSPTTEGDEVDDASAGSGADDDVDDDAGGPGKAADDPGAVASDAGSADGEGGGDPKSGAGKDDAEAGTDKTVAAGAADGQGGAEPAVNPKVEGAAEEPKPVDYEGFFKQVMAPLKANGKDYTPRTPEEAIRLMQMGAGFGRKLQDLQPHLKTLRMLEKESLLDPAELSFLIDLRNKNPEAIKKIIKDANIDPLDLNIEDNVNYTPVDRSVSDAEMNFGDAVTAVSAQTNGAETIQHINRTWDKQSLALLWEQPSLLETFHEQRSSGIYDKIVAEIEHQKVFGKIAPDTPFIQAYVAAGDALKQSGALGLPSEPDPAKVTETQPAPQPKVVATRTQPLKSAVANNDKANAAAPSRTTPKKASQLINPLEMADDVFMKQFEGRL